MTVTGVSHSTPVSEAASASATVFWADYDTLLKGRNKEQVKAALEGKFELYDDGSKNQTWKSKSGTELTLTLSYDDSGLVSGVNTNVPQG